MNDTFTKILNDISAKIIQSKTRNIGGDYSRGFEDGLLEAEMIIRKYQTEDVNK